LTLLKKIFAAVSLDTKFGKYRFYI
jgi:hypothetical protein